MENQDTNSDVLAQLRTLFALERNYLAEERTQLAKLRTGLSLALFVPPIYIYITSIQSSFSLYALLLFIIFLIPIIIWSIFMIMHSRSDLKKIRKKKALVKYREEEIIGSSKKMLEIFKNSYIFENKTLKKDYKNLKTIKKTQNQSPK